MAEKKCAHIFREGNCRYNYCPLCGIELKQFYAFQKGDSVWVLDNIESPEIINAKVTSVSTYDYGIVYNLQCDNGMSLGEWPGGIIFKTKEDLVKFYENILHQ